jgi:hypothetical protein
MCAWCLYNINNAANKNKAQKQKNSHPPTVDAREALPCSYWYFNFNLNPHLAIFRFRVRLNSITRRRQWLSKPF